MDSHLETAGPVLDLPVADLLDGQPAFGSPHDFRRALELGAFLARIPTAVDVGPGLTFCKSYFLPRTDSGDRYRGHRNQGHSLSKLGYEDRPDQVEQLQLENHTWPEYLPQDVLVTLAAMRRLTISILNATLDHVGAAVDDRRAITGADRADGASWCHTTMNHYRTALAGRPGIFEHKDSGFITLIYSDGPGLEIFHDGEWKRAEYRSDCFTVNYGASLGVLTENLPNPVTAVLHRVPEIDPHGPQHDRSSFTVYLGPDYDSDLLTYAPDGGLVPFANFRDFSLEQARKQRYEFHARL
ncbi:2OG-Fe(II) oxygenase family protein [Jatrophihabitans lederbergiae]|uniref:2OG-Fe(II) oxygenase family protein n=1 Tax=Jatrophihabitans lederbergiae TaxID=3075547 RepID=A0ABU2JFZ6_9ACTN|nr:2OG-Fe(II) oxygenase family protein [Jatrophihabitans sp. DSM 44399]MDT0263922.1 2OG-Fe(II) oxygenase family protein [Jatrophihabitans sp. DSM 44399]